MPTRSKRERDFGAKVAASPSATALTGYLHSGRSVVCPGGWHFVPGFSCGALLPWPWPAPGPNDGSATAVAGIASAPIESSTAIPLRIFTSSSLVRCGRLLTRASCCPGRQVRPGCCSWRADRPAGLCTARSDRRRCPGPRLAVPARWPESTGRRSRARLLVPCAYSPPLLGVCLRFAYPTREEPCRGFWRERGGPADGTALWRAGNPSTAIGTGAGALEVSPLAEV